MRATLWKGLGAAALLAAAVTTVTAAEDYRKRASHEGAGSYTKVSDVEAEIKFGRDVGARVLGRYRLQDDKRLTRYLNLVGKAVALHAGRPEIEYRFALLQSDNVNAYAAPGGYIFITTGALAQMRDESELAAVLAHEVAHVTERHIVKALNIRGADQSPEAGLARLVGGAGDPARVAFHQAVDKAMEILFEKGLQQQDEFDSDRIALTLLANTGYDPGALKRYLARVQALKGGETKVVSTTHPSFDSRLAKIDELARSEGFAELKQPTVKERFNEYVKTSKQ